MSRLYQNDVAGDMFETGKVHRKDSKCEARLVFPEHYDEAVENTPARILYTEYHGSGSNYRQCFYNKELNYQEYDKLFEMAVVMDKLEVLVNMSFGRLEFPYELTEKAREEYQGYIKKNLRDDCCLSGEAGRHTQIGSRISTETLDFGRNRCCP